MCFFAAVIPAFIYLNINTQYNTRQRGADPKAGLSAVSARRSTAERRVRAVRAEGAVRRAARRRKRQRTGVRGGHMERLRKVCRGRTMTFGVPLLVSGAGSH